jgi:hypothetical protein
VTSTLAPSPYRAAVDACDPAALAAACAPDLVFHSPISNAARFQGPAEIERLYRTVLEIYDEQHLVAEYRSGDTLVVHLQARIGSQEMDEIQVLRLNDEGKVYDITMYVRPLPGLTRLAATLAPRLAPSPWRALLVAMMLRPLAFITRVGDRLGVRLVQPGP